MPPALHQELLELTGCRRDLDATGLATARLLWDQPYIPPKPFIGPVKPKKGKKPKRVKDNDDHLWPSMFQYRASTKSLIGAASVLCFGSDGFWCGYETNQRTAVYSPLTDWSAWLPDIVLPLGLHIHSEEPPAPQA